MNEALDANADPHLSEHPSGEEMRSRMTSLVDEIERTTRIGVRLWTLAGLVGCFSLAMGTYNHRPLSMLMALVCIGFSAWNVRASLRAAREMKAWRDEWSRP